MLIITKLLFSALFGMMVFFSGIITPVAFKNLPEKNLSIFLRKVFPKLFALGFVLSIIGGVLLYVNNSFIPFVLSTIISLGFIVNLIFLTPKINYHKDNSVGEKKLLHEKKFAFFHRISVLIYLVQLILILTFLIKY